MNEKVNFYENRKFIIGGIFVAVALVYLINLFQLQIVDQSAKSLSARNFIRTQVRYPARGLMYDRNGKLIVFNKAAYDLRVTPKEMEPFDTVDLCNTLEIEKDFLIRQIKAARSYSWYKPYVILSQLTAMEFAQLQEKMYRFPGFSVVQRVQRSYNYHNAGHVLGYISEVNGNDIKKDDYYVQGDYIGKTGLEQTYENELRGVKGKRFLTVNSKGAITGPYQEGKSDVIPVPGKNLTLSLDIELQAYGEKLMQNKLGSIVAIEPSSGEVLAFISAPEFDPSKLVGRHRGAGYAALAADTLKPLNNRALQGTYSPGSTFKLVCAAIGLQEGALNDYTRFSCEGPLSYPISCTHYHQSPLGVLPAIETSCNPFFYKTFKETLEQKGQNTRVGYQKWYDHVKSFGFGDKLGIDLPYEIKGNLPTVAYYDKLYGKTGWRAITVRSLGIGQGELLVTPLQLANEAVTIANRGYFYRPHMVKAIQNQSLSENYTYKNQTSINKEYFEDVVIKGMEHVYDGTHGTARDYRNDSLIMCGKTGTVQNPFGYDHSVFIAFAPKDNPKIAICVIVENGGYGTTWAAPMATFIMEKYIFGKLPKRHKWKEQQIFDADIASIYEHNRAREAAKYRRSSTSNETENTEEDNSEESKPANAQEE